MTRVRTKNLCNLIRDGIIEKPYFFNKEIVDCEKILTPELWNNLYLYQNVKHAGMRAVCFGLAHKIAVYQHEDSTFAFGML